MNCNSISCLLLKFTLVNTIVGIGKYTRFTIKLNKRPSSDIFSEVCWQLLDNMYEAESVFIQR